MSKIYRKFYDIDDKEVWASYDPDSKDIEVLLQHDWELSGEETFAQILAHATSGDTWLPPYKKRVQQVLEHILDEECGISVSYQSWNFPVYNDEPQEEFTFSEEDAVSSDGCQYKFFCDRGGNWVEFVALNPDGELESLGEGHLDYIPLLLEELLLSKSVDYKSFARYSEDSDNTEYHVPTEEDFLKDFDITR